MGLWSTVASFARDERVILAALTVASGLVVTTMGLMLEHLRDDAEIRPVQPKTQYITQETEDSLRLGTLDTLLGLYNFAIRETAAKIVCDRAVNDAATVEALLWGIAQPDYEERMKSLRCLAIITDAHTLHLLHNWKAYAALVRSLELCLSDVEREKLDDEHFDEYYLRDMAEKLCIMFVSQLLQRYDAEKLVKARFVDKWLARQYWGDSEEEVLDNFAKYDRKNNRITAIIQHLRDSASGRQALAAAGLIRRGDSEGADDGENGDDTGGFSFVLSLAEGAGDQSLPRVLDQTPEEQRLRHRHRDAMVYNDGSHPLNRGDIIERDPMSPA